MLNLLKSFAAVSFFLFLQGCSNSSSCLKIKVFGESVKISEIENAIIKSEAMQRLKFIDQSGPMRYFRPEIIPAFSRFDHSIGVWYLVKRFSKSGSELECCAALLHDASVPAFSHMSDFLIVSLKENGVVDQNDGFQDRTHLNFLKSSDICILLTKKFGFSANDLNYDNESYKCLEQKLPDMCADRIEYNIHTALLTEKITFGQAKKMIDSLRFENNKWFFIDPIVARNFAELSLYFNPNLWSSHLNSISNFHFAEAVRFALKKNLLNMHDLYLTDVALLKKLEKCTDDNVQTMLLQSRNPEMKITKKGYSYKKFHIKTKFRGIDPLVLTASGQLKRLSEIDFIFKNYYEQTKKLCNRSDTIDRLCKN